MGSVDEEEPKTRWEKIFEEGKEEEKFVIGRDPDWGGWRPGPWWRD